MSGPSPEEQRRMLQAIDQFHATFSAEVLDAATRLANDLSAQARAFVDDAQSKYRAVFDEINKIDLPWLLDTEYRERIARAFAFADMIPSPSMSREVVRLVTDAYESGNPRALLVRMVMEESDANDCQLLATIVANLSKIDEFAVWTITMQQALTAHKLSLDAIAAYPLLSMIEGVVTRFFMANKPGLPRVKHTEIADNLNYPALAGFSVGFEAMECLLRFLKDSVYNNMDASDFTSTDTDSNKFNRHRLLHGMLPQSSREHTLRCFQILDCLGVWIPAARNILKR